MATLDDLIRDLKKIANKEQVAIEFNLHEGIRDLLATFHGAATAAAWFEEYKNTRAIPKDI